MSDTLKDRFPWDYPRYSRMTVLAAFIAGCGIGCILVLLGYLIIDAIT